jgi:hypothetical protein
MFRKVGGFPNLSMAYLQSATNLATSGYGVGENSFGLEVMPKLDRLQVFLMSYMAPTEIVPDRVKTKPLFWLTRPELSVFEDLTPDARAGGFGPLYGTMLVLSLIAAGTLFFWHGLTLASLFPILPVVMSMGLTQTWWARWAPQGWLLPVALLLPVLVCLTQQGGGVKKWLAALAVFTGLLNSGLILLFYSIGCVKAQRVLNSQLAFVKTFPQPIAVYMPRFKSNRIWLIREKVEFVFVDKPPRKPSIRLMRTETLIPLPAKWEENLGIGPKVDEWRKRRLIEE